MADEHAPKRDFFISRAGSDKAIAIAVRSIVQSAGYTTWLQDDDFDQASFMARMAQGWSSGARLVCLLSRAYQQSEHCKKEYEVALTGDPRNLQGRVIVLRIENYMPVEHLADLAFTDLMPLLHKPDDLTRAVLGAVGTRDRKDVDFAALFRRSGTQLLHPEVRPVPDFTGRDAELGEIESALWKSGGRAALTGSTAAAVRGLGGVGKSVLAQEYAWRNRDRYHGVWWIRAEKNETLLDDLIELGAHFVANLKEVPDRHQAAQTALTQIAQGGTEKPWLLVYDNVEEPGHIEKLTPRTGAHVLITTRWGDWGRVAAPVKVGVFAQDVAAKFLIESTGRGDRDAAAKLAAALGHLPLALDHAAAYCRRTGIDFATYEKLAADLIRKAPKGVDYDTPVFATFSLAIDKAAEACPEANKLMGVCAFLAPDRIPLNIFTKDVLSEIERGEAVAALQEVSLATLEALDDGSPALSVHRLVQEVMRGRLKEMEEHENGAALATELVADAFPNENPGPDDVRAWPACARLMPHAVSVFEYAPESGTTASKTTLLLTCVSTNLVSRASFAESEPLMRRAHAINEAILGPDHPDVAHSLINLAHLLQSTNRPGEAEPLSRRALSIIEESRGPEHTEVAINLSNLAQLLTDTNRFGEAEPLMRRALAIGEGSLGPNHPSVALYLNNLAYLLHATNRPAEAEPLYRRALAIDEVSFGHDHPSVARDLNNLAGLLSDTNRRGESEPLLRRALAIDEASLGPDHPSVALYLNNLARLLENTNRQREAEPLYRRALAINEASLGLDHPSVATSLNNLAGLLHATNRVAEAEPLHRRALAIDEASFGPDHPDVAIRLNDLAQLLQHTNRLSEAEPLIRRAVAISESSLGPNHPTVATYLNNLALLLSATNRPAEAEPLYRRALAITQASLGPDHPGVATTLNNQARLLEDTNRYAEAEPLYRRALAINEASLGPDHPRVATSLNNLAQVLKATNQLAEAEPLLRRALEIFETSLGLDHPSTKTVGSNLDALELALQEAVASVRAMNPDGPRATVMKLEAGTEQAKPSFLRRLFGRA